MTFCCFLPNKSVGVAGSCVPARSQLNHEESSPFSPMADLQEFWVCRPHIVWQFLTDPPAIKLHAGFVSISTNLCFVQSIPSVIRNSSAAPQGSQLPVLRLSIIQDGSLRAEAPREGSTEIYSLLRVKNSQGPCKKKCRGVLSIIRVEYFEDLIGQIINVRFCLQFFSYTVMVSNRRRQPLLAGCFLLGIWKCYVHSSNYCTLKCWDPRFHSPKVATSALILLVTSPQK